MKVLFSRKRNDFEHVYDLSSVPRVGEHVGLLDSPHESFAQQYVVTRVHWTPDHTSYDVSVRLERLTREKNADSAPFSATELNKLNEDMSWRDDPETPSWVHED